MILCTLSVGQFNSLSLVNYSSILFSQLVFFHPPPAIVVRFTVFALTMVSYIVLMNYFGQKIIDKTEEVFQAAYYDSEWYAMTPKMRRYILLILNNSTKRKTLTAGKMGEVSLEVAGIVIFETFSYTLVLKIQSLLYVKFCDF